jgi:hypothetical protein
LKNCIGIDFWNQDGKTKEMKHVRVGDFVKSVDKDGNVIYDEIYMMAHADPTATRRFVKVHHVRHGSKPSFSFKLHDCYFSFLYQNIVG